MKRFPNPRPRHGTARRTGRLVALGGVLAVVLGAMALLGSHAAARSAAVAGVSDPIAWRACATTELPTRECGELVVPLSYREPQGATISLTVGRVPATDPARRIGSLFLNPGGPGQPGFEELAIMYAALPAALPARFDVVGFDPRGIGESAPVRCFAGPEEQAAFFATMPRVPAGAAEEGALLRANEELARRCGERNAALLPHLSTANVARDLDRLRQAVGDQRLTYWGVSYGTYLGETYANLFPDRIRAIVLDGVINPPSYASFDHGDGAIVGPDTTSFLRVLSNQGSADTFGQFIDQCAQAGVPRCAFAAPSAAETRAKFDALMERLHAQPAILMGPAGTLTVTYSLAIDLMLQVLYQDPLWPIMAQALQHLYEGDAAGFLVATGALGGPPPTEYRNPIEARAASNCLDTDNPADPARYVTMARAAEERTPYFGALWTYISLPCAFWPAQDADRYRGPWNAPTSATILLISRLYDPATPHGGAVLASQTLANARLLTIDGWGHGFYIAGKSTCADDAAAAYLIDGRLPAEGTVCPQDASPFGDPPAAPSATVAAQGDFAGLVDIDGGRRLYLECRGAGSPTVVLVAGYRSHGGVWSIDYLQPDAPRTMVLPTVAASTRVCAYDRPGTIFDPDDLANRVPGDPVPQPTAAEPMVADLHALLQVAGVPGPYVLAGHSLGGLLVRLYAATYPDEVAGLVLVDALSEGIQARMTPAQLSAYGALLLQPPPGFETMTGIETLDLGASFAQIRAAATPLRPMPLAVLSKGQPFELPPDLPVGFSRDAFERAWQAAQADLPRLVASARHGIALRSGHGVQLEQPALVTEAIRQVVAGVRNPDTWADLASCCAN